MCVYFPSICVCLVEGGEGEDEDDVSQMLSDDYARAEFIRDRLVPKAVLFFTGEIMDEEDDVRKEREYGHVG